MSEPEYIIKAKEKISRILEKYDQRQIEIKPHILDRAIKDFEHTLIEGANKREQYEKFNVTRTLPFTIRTK